MCLVDITSLSSSLFFDSRYFGTVKKNLTGRGRYLHQNPTFKDKKLPMPRKKIIEKY